MHITKVEIENIKSYKSAVYEFGRGTTAITGENGAGKTTIIEAIAWVLFDLLDYKKDDFLRRGKKKGMVRVEFESGLDERRYVVQRDTKTAYFVYDPRLETRIADKKEEVTRFLWQHLGVEPGTDLESLFRRAIGVPQGTFTAVFLETPTERKKAFDKLLKVEEYRVGSIRLGQTAKYVDGLILEIVQKIARSEGALSGRKNLNTELKAFKAVEKELGGRVKELTKTVSKRRKALEKLELSKKNFDELTAAVNDANQEEKRLKLVFEQKSAELKNAETAAGVVEQTKEAHESHLDAMGKIKELERERIQREKLRAELVEVEKAILHVNAEKQKIKTLRDEIEQKQKELGTLKPKAEEQKRLEAEHKQLEAIVGEKTANTARISEYEQELGQLRERHRENDAELKACEEFETVAKGADALRKRDREIRTNLAAAKARLEKDREFQIQVKDGMCPIFSAKCLNLKPGESLDGFLTGRSAELELLIKNLTVEQNSVSKELDAAQSASAAIAKLPNLRKRREEIVKDGKKLRKKQDELTKSVENLDQDKKRLEEVSKQIAALGDPKSRLEHISKDILSIGEIRQNSTKADSNFERLESERRLKVEQIDIYKDLDDKWKLYTEIRDRTAVAHRKFIENESAAKNKSKLLSESESAKEKLSNLQLLIGKTSKKLEEAQQNFDAGQYTEKQNELRSDELELTRIETENKTATSRILEIEKSLEALKTTEEQLVIDKKEKERLDKLRDTVSFIRNTLKSAAPRVAKNYVFHVSVEANTLYRDITGNAESTLRWTDDYGVELEENGFSRPFVALSGGEQMSAALAVRLALLRQLSDIKIAFFDEPTTNMDLERREGLAEQISRITENQTFDQLFVISHDDTFESYADHVLAIEK